jgi:predicted dehydrogenase
VNNKIDVTIIGGGMITEDLILPSVYHLQRTGIVGEIKVCALNSKPLKVLMENKEICQAFPGHKFSPFPDITERDDKLFPELYREVLRGMSPRQAVVVAVPDQFHYRTVMDALDANQHILCVKPLVLKYKQAVAIEKKAFERGLFIGIEYHKRFDRRSLIAKRSYSLGEFGEFRMGEAKMIEPSFYRNSNFQNWFTTDQTDPFVYVGCHYVDLAYFITGLRPVEVSVQGVTGLFPNGNEGYMWANGRVRFENDALLTVTNGLMYPDEGAGANDQSLIMFCENNGEAGLIEHNDQFRGVIHSYMTGKGAAKKRYHYVNPDFYRLVPWEGEGSKPIGYGYDSISATLSTIYDIENKADPFSKTESLRYRQNRIHEIDQKGIIATPANSSINELVVEAARLSILGDGIPVKINYGKNPHVEPRIKEYKENGRVSFKAS